MLGVSQRWLTRQAGRRACDVRVLTVNMSSPQLNPIISRARLVSSSSKGKARHDERRNGPHNDRFGKIRTSLNRQNRQRSFNDALEEDFDSHNIEKRLRGCLLGEKMRERILGWGIDCEEFERGAKQILKLPEASEDRSSALLTRLILLFYKEANQSLRHCIEQQTSNEFWDGKALVSIRLESFSDELPRQAIASFLAWLERHYSNISNAEYMVAHLRSLLSVADLRFPSLEYATARSFKRHIHLHVGPTNSGKTHGALTALCKSRTGVYAGPLRLLAHEVWDRINSGTVSPGVPARPCNLRTGEETKVMDEQASLLACTVEMLNPEEVYDVAVVDEIQMIGDPQRGFAWTAAVLGLAAKEIHLCGEKSVVELIKRMAKACGDEVHVHEYERLTPLKTSESLQSLANVQKGDCVVAFSRTGIFQTKEDIERQTGLKCAVVYGALPPETKAEQAKIFNDPNNDIDVMVASDAIGMGLNLKIKRVVFTTTTKWNGTETKEISRSQLKQIAGRAGRYDSQKTDDAKAGGIATTIDPLDLPVLEAALVAPLKPITHAAIQADEDRIERLSTLLRPERVYDDADKDFIGFEESRPRPLSKLLRDLTCLTRIDTTSYFADTLEQQDEFAPVIEKALPKHAVITLSERATFSKAPVNARDEHLLALMGNVARLYAHGKLVSFEDAEKGLGLLRALYDVEKAKAWVRDNTTNAQDTVSTAQGEAKQDKASQQRPTLDVNVLMTLESLHRGLTLYMWLSMRFPVNFCYGWKVELLCKRTEAAIEFCLDSIRLDRQRRLAQMGRLADNGQKKRGKRTDKGSLSSHRRSKDDQEFGFTDTRSSNRSFSSPDRFV